MITAKNKMYSANKISALISYSGKSYTLPQLSLVDENIKANRDLVAESASGWINNKNTTFDKNLFFYQKVCSEEVFKFLTEFKYVAKEDIAPCLQYIKEGADKNLAYWDVAILPTLETIKEEEHFDLTLLSASKRTLRNHMFTDNLSVSLQDAGGRIARPWYERYGLTIEQYQKAEQEKTERGIKQTAAFYRKNRTCPLLTIVFMDIYQKNNDKPIKKLVPGFAISFPHSDISSISYEVNKTYYNQLLAPFQDGALEETLDDDSE